jgi:hypothetical protein
MTTLFYFLSILYAFTSASNIRGGDKGFDLRAEFDEDGIHHTDLSRRRRLAAQCPYDGGTVNFNVQTRVNPTLESPICSDETLMSIGVMINSALLNAGIATYQNSIFLAGVCNTPLVVTEENNVVTTGKNPNGDHSMGVTGATGGTTGFIWTGGGVGCNYHVDIGRHCCSMC